jgi:hypothetical protein
MMTPSPGGLDLVVEYPELLAQAQASDLAFDQALG